MIIMYFKTSEGENLLKLLPFFSQAQTQNYHWKLGHLLELFWTIYRLRLRPRTTDTQTELFFKNLKLLGLGRQIGLKLLEAFGGIFSQTISTILALWFPCPWENVACSFSYKKLRFLGLKHIAPKIRYWL